MDALGQWLPVEIAEWLRCPSDWDALEKCDGISYAESVAVPSRTVLPFVASLFLLLAFAFLCLPAIDRTWVRISSHLKRTNHRVAHAVAGLLLTCAAWYVCALFFARAVEIVAVRVPSVIGFNPPYYELGACLSDPAPPGCTRNSFAAVTGTLVVWNDALSSEQCAQSLYHERGRLTHDAARLVVDMQRFVAVASFALLAVRLAGLAATSLADLAGAATFVPFGSPPPLKFAERRALYRVWRAVESKRALCRGGWRTRVRGVLSEVAVPAFHLHSLALLATFGLSQVSGYGIVLAHLPWCVGVAVMAVRAAAAWVPALRVFAGPAAPFLALVAFARMAGVTPSQLLGVAEYRWFFPLLRDVLGSAHVPSFLLVLALSSVSFRMGVMLVAPPEGGRNILKRCAVALYNDLAPLFYVFVMLAFRAMRPSGDLPAYAWVLFWGTVFVHGWRIVWLCALYALVGSAVYRRSAAPKTLVEAMEVEDAANGTLQFSRGMFDAAAESHSVTPSGDSAAHQAAVPRAHAVRDGVARAAPPVLRATRNGSAPAPSPRTFRTLPRAVADRVASERVQRGASAPPDIGSSRSPARVAKSARDLGVVTEDADAAPPSPSPPSSSARTAGLRRAAGAPTHSGPAGELDCVVCWVGRREFAVLDCGHFCLCATCVEELMERADGVECPTCRAPATEFRRIFVA